MQFLKEKISQYSTNLISLTQHQPPEGDANARGSENNFKRSGQEASNNYMVDESVAFYECEDESSRRPSEEIRDQHLAQQEFKYTNAAINIKNGFENNTSSGEQSFFDCNDTLTPSQFDAVSHRSMARGLDVTKKKHSHQVTPEFSRRQGSGQEGQDSLQKRSSSDLSQERYGVLSQQALNQLQAFGSEVTFQYKEDRFAPSANQQVGSAAQIQFSTNNSSQSKSYQTYQERKQRQSKEISKILSGNFPQEMNLNILDDKACTAGNVKSKHKVSFDQGLDEASKLFKVVPHKQQQPNDVALQNRMSFSKLNKEGDNNNPFFQTTGFQQNQARLEDRGDYNNYNHANFEQRNALDLSQTKQAKKLIEQQKRENLDLEFFQEQNAEYANDSPNDFGESPSKQGKTKIIVQNSDDHSSSSNMRRIIQLYEQNVKALNKKQKSFLSSVKLDTDVSRVQQITAPSHYADSNYGSNERLDLSNLSKSPSMAKKSSNRTSQVLSHEDLSSKIMGASPTLQNKNSVGIYGQNFQRDELQYQLNQRSDSHQLNFQEYQDFKESQKIHSALKHQTSSSQSPSKLSQSRNSVSSHSVHINNSVINAHYHHYPQPISAHQHHLPLTSQSLSNLQQYSEQEATPLYSIKDSELMQQMNHTEVDEDLSQFKSSSSQIKSYSKSAYSKSRVQESRNALQVSQIQQFQVPGYEGQQQVRKLSKVSHSAQKNQELMGEKEQQDFFVIAKGGSNGGANGLNGSSLNSMSMLAQNASSFQQINLQSMNNSVLSNFKSGVGAIDNFKRKPSSSENNQDPISVSKLSSSSQSGGLSGGGAMNQKLNALSNFEKNLNQKYPGYFQDYSTGQDLIISEVLPKSSSGTKALDPSLSIFRTQSFLSQKNNSHGGIQPKDNIKKISLFTDSNDQHLLPPKGQSDMNLRQQHPIKSLQQSSTSLQFGGVGSNNSGSNQNTPQQQLRQLLPSQAVTKTKLMNKTYTELNNLTSVQEIKCGTNAIWCIRFRGDGLYLGTGGMDGVLRIWKVCESPSEMVNRQTIMPQPYREFHNAHSSDILDISWSSKNPNLVLTASADYNVLIFDINVERQLRVLQHPSYVTSAHFKINSENYFASGCLDKIVRVWCIKTKKVIDWVQTACEITALKYSNCGERLYVGLVNGDVLIFDSTQEKLIPVRTVICKNKRGKFSKGRKVTSIDFLSLNIAMITTNDSRIRFIDARTGKQIYKIKGHKNESFPIRASISDDLAHVICGSEDGDLYLWSQIQSTVVQMSKKTLLGKLLLLNSDKSNSCEYFTPFSKSQSVTAAVFAPQQVILAQMRRHFKIAADKAINMIIVTANMQGVIKIYHNETSSQSPNTSPKHAKSAKYKRHSVNI